MISTRVLRCLNSDLKARQPSSELSSPGCTRLSVELREHAPRQSTRTATPEPIPNDGRCGHLHLAKKRAQGQGKFPVEI